MLSSFSLVCIYYFYLVMFKESQKTSFYLFLFVSLFHSILSSYSLYIHGNCFPFMTQFHQIITGVYGDVIRVKILYNKRDSALIQFKEPQHAQTGMLVKKKGITWFSILTPMFLAIANLNGVALYGKKLHVTHSKHAQVQMPQAGSTVSYVIGIWGHWLLIW